MSDESTLGPGEPAEWNPDEVVKNLIMEREMMADEITSPEEHIKRIMRDNAPFAAQSVVWLSKYSENEKTRFDAARYIIERVIGKVDSTGYEDETTGQVERLLEKIFD